MHPGRPRGWAGRDYNARRLQGVLDMGTFSLWHWLIVLLIVVLVFGTKKLKNIGQDLGGAVKGFSGIEHTALELAVLGVLLLHPAPLPVAVLLVGEEAENLAQF